MKLKNCYRGFTIRLCGNNFAGFVADFENTLSFKEKKINYKIFPYYQKVEVDSEVEEERSVG